MQNNQKQRTLRLVIAGTLLLFNLTGIMLTAVHFQESLNREHKEALIDTTAPADPDFIDVDKMETYIID